MNEATNRYPFKNENPNTDEVYDSCKSDEDDGCEVDRRMNQCKNRSHGHDAYNNADDERWVVSSSDDTSNEKKLIS